MEEEFKYAKLTSEEINKEIYGFFEKNDEKLLNNEVEYSKLNLIQKNEVEIWVMN